jgi:UDP-N-acetyl-D-mannosaminuronic acid dehydrogenase
MSDDNASRQASDVGVAPIERVVILGTGFIGLPLALLLAKHGKRVIGVDVDEDRVRTINDASLYPNDEQIGRMLEEESGAEYFDAQVEPVPGDAFVVSVPTPIEDPQKNPDLTHLKAAIDSILPYLEAGNIINIESTIPPLTCEEVVIPRLREEGFEPGDDIQLAHSPERILPGNVFEEIRHNDRIIGGVDDASCRRAGKIYEPFLEGDIYYTNIVSAELTKLMENTFRDINVAIANEFALIGDELGVNIQEVLALANNHPRVDILDPGIGVGGHCLPVDPWFLNEADPEHTNLITTARRINDMMPQVATRKIRRVLSDFADPNILALGLTYKPNSYDTRNSPALDIVEELRLDGYTVETYDRHAQGMQYESLASLLEEHAPDVVLQLVPHDETLEEIDCIKTEPLLNNIQIIQFAGDHRFSPKVI